MTNVSEWSVTAGLNISSPPDGWPEGMQRSAVNDAAREMMAAIARWYKDSNAFLVSTGTAPAFILTSSSGYSSLSDLGLLTFIAHAPSTSSAATLTVDSLPTKSLVAKDGTALWIGDIRLNQAVAVIYNGVADRFELVNEIGDRPGTLKAWAPSVAPPGWLLSYGQSLLRADYPYLFGAISTTYGAADGTHFNVPDLRGRVTGYKDDMGGSSADRLTAADDGLNGDTLGATGGFETQALAETNVATHAHTQQGSFASGTQSTLHVHTGFTSTDGGHSHTYLLPNANVSVQLGGANTFGSSGTSSTSVSGTGTHAHSALSLSFENLNHTHSTTISGSTTNAGSGTPFGIIQPTIILNGIIKT